MMPRPGLGAAGRYPTNDEGLSALINSPTNVKDWAGPYVKQIPNDPWGHAYVYRSPGQHGSYDLISYGADGQEGGSGTAGDITSWVR